jgi:hypothetical protein
LQSERVFVNLDPQETAWLEHITQERKLMHWLETKASAERLMVVYDKKIKSIENIEM